MCVILAWTYLIVWTILSYLNYPRCGSREASQECSKSRCCCVISGNSGCCYLYQSSSCIDLSQYCAHYLRNRRPEEVLCVSSCASMDGTHPSRGVYPGYRSTATVRLLPSAVLVVGRWLSRPTVLAMVYALQENSLHRD